jgi:putative ABC transport system substrate-binding protein
LRPAFSPLGIVISLEGSVVSNNIPADEIVKLIANFQPDYKKIGFLYTSSETNSVSTITAAKKYCDDNNIAYEESSISNVSELQTAVESLISKGVDALYTGNDNTIASAMATYTDAAYAKKVPIYCGADSMVADGGFATVGVNYVQLGKQVADMVEKIANGEKVSDIPYETISDYAKYVNMQAVKQFGGNFDKKAFEGFDVLVEEDGTSHFNK